MTGSEIYILCEGYHDRAFWKGLLTYAGCASLGGPGKKPSDPWGETVHGGQYAFENRNKAFLRVVPAGSKYQLIALAETRLRQRAPKTVTHLIINHDSDSFADGTPSTARDIQFSHILQLAKKLDPGAQKSVEHVISVDNGTSKIIAFPWCSTDPPAPGVPNQQTLERLICSALAAVHKDRPAPLEAWLKSRPSPPPPNPKEHAFSYLAGWFADKGSYEAFCEALWNDPQVAAELRGQLERQGVWTLIEEIAEIR